MNFIVPFLVVDLPSPYYIIIGRPTLITMGGVISMEYLLMKFPTDSEDQLVRRILLRSYCMGGGAGKEKRRYTV